MMGIYTPKFMVLEAINTVERIRSGLRDYFLPRTLPFHLGPGSEPILLGPSLINFYTCRSLFPCLCARGGMIETLLVNLLS